MSIKFKSLDDYDNVRPTLHYLLIYPYCGDYTLEEFRDFLFEYMPSRILEYKIAIQDDLFYVILKFEFGVIVPLLSYDIERGLGKDTIEDFQYFKISGVKKADAYINKDSQEIHSNSYLQTEKRRCSSKDLFNYNREKQQFLNQKEKTYQISVMTHIGPVKTLEEFLKDCEEQYEKDFPKPKK